MKVIAKVDNNRVLCEVSVEELAFLNGFYSIYDQGFDSRKMSEVGAECDLKKMVATSRFVRSMDKTVIQTINKSLQEAMDKVNEAGDFVNKLTLFETLKD